MTRRPEHRDRYIASAPDAETALARTLEDRKAVVGLNGLESTSVEKHAINGLWAVTLVYDREKRTEW